VSARGRVPAPGLGDGGLGVIGDRATCRYLRADGSAAVGLHVDGRLVDAFVVADAAGWPGVFPQDAAGGLEVLLADWPGALAALADVRDLVRERGAGAFGDAAVDPDAVEQLAPLARPCKILSAGANYHVEPATGQPYLFLRTADTIVGPRGAIERPAGFVKLDYEVVLGAVIGGAVKGVSAQDALSHVAGYVLANDVSLRDRTMRADWPSPRTDWVSGVNLDRSLPLGPYLVPAESIPRYGELRMRLWVNGELRQDERAGDMTHSLERQLALAAQTATLHPGDVLLCGTHVGVAFGMDGDAWLRPGDLVEAEIDGLGRQCTPVVDAEVAAAPS
jgi:2-keto-4-pentenoate hydratase/2-oxohepta-3-ene-1,7-dioic acid hydratase in catechol pathway